MQSSVGGPARTAGESYRAALDLLGACSEARTTEELCRILLPRLQRVVGCDEVSVGVVGLGRAGVLHSAGFPTQMRDVPVAARLWVERPYEHPWLVHLAGTRDLRAARLSDVTRRTSLVGSLYWTDFYTPRRLRFADFATLSTAQNRAVGLSLGRSLRDFNRAEHELFEQLRRPLGRLWERLDAQQQRTRAAAPSPTSARVGPPLSADEPLTTAQRRVVELVLEGLSNAEVADALGVSVKAVEGQLTTAYRRLGVRSRTQLVLRVTEPGTTRG